MRGDGDVRVLLRKWREQYELKQQTAAEIFTVPLNTYVTWENKIARTRRFDAYAAMLRGYGYEDLDLASIREMVFAEEYPSGMARRTPRNSLKGDDAARMLSGFCLEFGVNGTDLAKELGVTYSTYRGWVDGRHCPPGQMLPLALEALTIRYQQKKSSTSQ